MTIQTTGDTLDNTERLAQNLVVVLAEMGIPATATGSMVKSREGTPVIVVLRVDVQERDQMAVLVQADIVFALNPEVKESCILDSAVGWAETLGEAINSATRAWAQTTAPAVFSLLESRPVHDCEWFPDGDEAGLPTKDTFAGPYGLRGTGEGPRILREHVQAHPLLSALSECILPFLTNRYINYLKLYAGYVNSEWTFEGTVNGRRCPELSAALSELEWPVLTTYTSVTLFALALSTDV